MTKKKSEGFIMCKKKLRLILDILYICNAG